MRFKEFEIRKAAPHQAAEISKLTTRVASIFVLPTVSLTRGKEIVQSMSPPMTLGYMTLNCQYYIALLDGKIVGVVAIRDNKHLFQLFVDPKHHYKGIARALWEYVRDLAMSKGNPGKFTVYASHYAEDVYKKFGFKTVGAKGDVVIPMTWLKPAGFEVE